MLPSAMGSAGSSSSTLSSSTVPASSGLVGSSSPITTEEPKHSSSSSSSTILVSPTVPETVVLSGSVTLEQLKRYSNMKTIKRLHVAGNVVITQGDTAEARKAFDDILHNNPITHLTIAPCEQLIPTDKSPDAILTRLSRTLTHLKFEGDWDVTSKFLKAILEAAPDSTHLLDLDLHPERNRDSFFASVAQALTTASIPIPGEEKVNNCKKLRELCHNYMQAPSNNWVREAMNRSKTENSEHADYETCLMKLQHTQQEMKEGKADNLATLGRPHIEGRMLCQTLGIKMHVINWKDEGSKAVAEHWLIDSTGARQVEEKTINQDDKKLIHLTSYHNCYASITQSIPKKIIGPMMPMPTPPNPMVKASLFHRMMTQLVNIGKRTIQINQASEYWRQQALAHYTAQNADYTPSSAITQLDNAANYNFKLTLATRKVVENAKLVHDDPEKRRHFYRGLARAFHDLFDVSKNREFLEHKASFLGDNRIEALATLLNSHISAMIVDMHAEIISNTAPTLSSRHSAHDELEAYLTELLETGPAELPPKKVLEKFLTHLEGLLSAITKKLQQAQQQKLDAEQEIKHAEAQIASAEQEITHAELYITNARREVGAPKRIGPEQEIKDSEKRVQRAKQDISEVQQKIQQLEIQGQIKQVVESVKQKIASATLKLNTAQRDIALQRQHIESAKQKIAQAQQKIARANAILSKFSMVIMHYFNQAFSQQAYQQAALPQKIEQITEIAKQLADFQEKMAAYSGLMKFNFGQYDHLADDSNFTSLLDLFQEKLLTRLAALGELSEGSLPSHYNNSQESPILIAPLLQAIKTKQPQEQKKTAAAMESALFRAYQLDLVKLYNYITSDNEHKSVPSDLVVGRILNSTKYGELHDIIHTKMSGPSFHPKSTSHPRDELNILKNRIASMKTECHNLASEEARNNAMAAAAKKTGSQPHPSTASSAPLPHWPDNSTSFRSIAPSPDNTRGHGAAPLTSRGEVSLQPMTNPAKVAAASFSSSSTTLTSIGSRGPSAAPTKRAP